MTAPSTPEEAYSAYQQDPSPDNLYRTVQTLRPVIGYALNNNGSAADPFLRAKADVVAAEAVRSWKPDTGASLSSWTGTQMQRLTRMRRENLMPVKIPDRAWLDGTALQRAEREFIDRHGREPELEELADAAMLSPKRIAEVRRSLRKIAPAAAFGTDAVGSSAPTDPTFEEASSYIFQSSDATDRKILEMRTGYGGKYEPMAAQDVAAKLGLTAPQMSRRSARIAQRILNIQRVINQVHGGDSK